MKVVDNGDFKILAGNYRKLQESTGINRKDKLVKKMKSRAKMAFRKKSRLFSEIRWLSQITYDTRIVSLMNSTSESRDSELVKKVIHYAAT